MQIAVTPFIVRPVARRNEAARLGALVLPPLPPIGEKGRTVLALFR